MFYTASELLQRPVRFGVPPSGGQASAGEPICRFRMPGRLKAGVQTGARGDSKGVT